MPDRLGLRAYDSTSFSTLPSETVLRFTFSAPGQIATASVTRHLAAKQSHVLQKLDAKICVAEEKREKQLVHLTVISKQGTPVVCFGHVPPLH
jgi:hypothetical protein